METKYVYIVFELLYYSYFAIVWSNVKAIFFILQIKNLNGQSGTLNQFFFYQFKMYSIYARTLMNLENDFTPNINDKLSGSFLIVWGVLP